MTQDAWSHDALAETLTAGYRRQITLYREALSAARDMTAQIERGQSTDPLVARVVELLEEVQRIADELAPAMAKWNSAGVAATGPLADALAETAHFIREIQTHLETAARQARQSQAALVPDLTNLERRRTMRQAYVNGQ